MTSGTARSDSFEPSKMIWIGQEELARRIKDKKQNKDAFELVDLRLETDYQKGHIPGAQNVPIQKMRFELESRFEKQDEIIFYGYSREDLASANAVIMMVNKGFAKVALLDGGYKDWKGEIE